ncbi:hypothetical protein [Pseudoalteromonas denitrificans]|nr:hypothetical protein [Pseudoalteromonas denitrificans]
MIYKIVNGVLGISSGRNGKVIISRITKYSGLRRLGSARESLTC